jgi:hypothetical protein
MMMSASRAAFVSRVMMRCRVVGLSFSGHEGEWRILSAGLGWECAGVNEFLPVSIDTLQVVMNQFHGCRPIPRGKRFEDLHVFGMGSLASLWILEENQSSLFRHQVKNLDDSIKHAVLGGVNDFEMKIPVLFVDRLMAFNLGFSSL